MSRPEGKGATYSDLQRLPEGSRGEVLGGELSVAPAPLPRHSRTQRALGRFVGGPFDDDDGHGGPGGWWIFVEVDVRLSEHDIVRPDSSGWRRERLAHPGDLRPIDVVPDWVCEIQSPSTAGIDRVLKRRLYDEAGVEYYWLVDPEARTLEALELKEGQWLELGAWEDDAQVGIPPFEATQSHWTPW